MSPDAWADMINTARAQIQDGIMTKVVVARAIALQSQSPLDVDRAIQRLNQRYPDSYRFLFEPQVGHVFLCATPERLVWLHGKRVQSMALASTTKRGATPEQDAELATALMNSAKDRLEHDIVARSLRERFEALCQIYTMPDVPDIMRLSNLMHLITPIEGTLVRKGSVIALTADLHPTPALGGQPQQAAMNFIRDHEPIPRGWYGAPFGWVDAHLDGEFIVAIRSAITHNNEAWLYAGVGIVEASDPANEWTETTWKFKPMLEALSG